MNKAALLRLAAMEEEALLQMLDGWLMELPDDMGEDDAFEALVDRFCAAYNADDEAAMDFAEYLGSVWEA